MRIPWRWSVPIACAALAACAMAPPANTSRGFNDPKNTFFTATDPIRIGAVDLAPGEYLIQIVPHGTDLSFLRVTDASGMNVFVALQARQRLHTRVNPDEGTLAFVENPGGRFELATWEVPNHAYGYDMGVLPSSPASAATLTIRGPVLRTASR